MDKQAFTIEDVKRIRLEPGDVLVVTVVKLSDVERDHAQSYFASIFPHNAVMIVPAEIEFSAISGAHEFRASVAEIVTQEMQAYIDREAKRLWYGGGDHRPAGLVSAMPAADK